MSTERAFRAWDTQRKRFRIEFDWVIDPEDGTPIRLHISGEDVLCQGKSEVLIISEFIGVPDKNGKRIYEGDIGERNMDYTRRGVINQLRDRWVVERHGPSFLTVQIGEKPNPYCQRFSEIEIIGNIYENPELLTTSTPQQ